MSVGVRVRVGTAVIVAATRASIVASMSGVGVGVCVGSAATTIACTVASRSGVGVGAGVWLPNPQAMANKSAESNMPKIFIARILTWAARGLRGIENPSRRRSTRIAYAS